MYLLDSQVVLELRKAKAGRTDAGLATWATGVSRQNLFLSALSLLELENGAARVERAAAMPCIGSPGPGERKRGERDSPGHRYWSCTIDATEGTPFVFRMKSM